MKFSEYTYERPDIEQLRLDFSKLISEFKESGTADGQLTIIEKVNQLRSRFETMYQLCIIRHSIDTRETFYNSEQNFFDENLPLFESFISEYYSALINSSFKDVVENKFGKQLFRIAEMQLKAFIPEIIEDLINENKLSTEYQELIASALILFDGGEKTLAELTPYIRSTDRTIRKQAAIARWNFFVDHESQLDRIFDDLVKTRNTIAIKLGFKNFVEVGYLRMMRTDYNAEMVKDFRKQILDIVVPLSVEIKNKQAKRLNLSELKYYDEPLLFKSGNATPKGTSEEIIETGKLMYEELSEETGEFFSFMYSKNLMDLEAKKGKASGGYCTYIPGFRSPFIFSNFNGTSGDIDVLTHEVGHAFQVYMSREFETMEYLWPTSDAAEIHSMSMEYFAYPWMDNFFNGEADKYRYAHLLDSILFLPYGVAVDEFQHVIYEQPELTPAQRKELWSSIEKKYLPLRNYEDNEFLKKGGIWQMQAHIYQSPFYYIDYTLAQICAFQFWFKSQQNKKEAFNDYVKLCKAGGSRSFLELIKFANLKSPFEKETVEEVIKKVSSFLGKVDDSKLN